MAASANFREERNRGMGPSDFAPIAEILSQMRNDKGDILTKPFLDLSGSTLPVLGKRGVCENVPP